MSTYPSTLPPPKQEGYSLEVQTNDQELQAESGTSFLMSQSDDNPCLFNVQWTLSQEQADIFYTWFNDELNAGELAFDIDLLLESGMSTQSAVFVADSMDGYSLSNHSHYQISAQLFVSELNDPDTGGYEALTWFAERAPDGDAETGMALLDKAINVSAPEA